MKKFYLILLIFISQIFLAQSDCVSAIPLCGNSDISYFPTNSGDVDDQVNLNGSCLSSNERYSVWYKFTIATPGVLTFVISPVAPFNADYDFAVYGPNITCANKGAPIRCNYDGNNPAPNQTGLQIGATNPNGGGTPWSSPLNVLAGETYYLIVSNFSKENAQLPFGLSWGGTATLASPFNDPSVQPYPFNQPGVPGAQPDDPRIVDVCSATDPFNFQSLSPNIINGNPNFYIKYYYTSNNALADTNAITNPAFINFTDTYFYTVRYQDPANPNNPANLCFNVNKFKFRDASITTQAATLTSCNNNNNGVAIYNLTTANVIAANPTLVTKYYPTITDANNLTNEITNPLVYSSAAGNVYARVTTPLGCFSIAKITLGFYAAIPVNPASIETCFIESNPSTGLFDLTKPTVTTGNGMIKQYYPSETDAVNSTNPITNPTAYVSPSGTVYVKVIDGNGCYNIAKITLKVNPPVYSSILKDKQICIEGTTTLDAGPGFDQYLWSNGLTTSMINNVTVGSYYVRLKKGNCWTKQEVKVLPVELPVISNVNIGPNSISADVIGGHPPYVYSMDNQNWQDSNTFPNLPRGTYTIYVKDSFNCLPVQVEVTVPNIVNVITPNGDGINDAIDYSSLSRKKDLVFAVYDRYGSKIYQADKDNGYKWDGTILGKKLSTGTYWYSVSWKENDKLNTPVIYSGWILLKNRE